MHAIILTLGFAALGAAFQPGQIGSKGLHIKRYAHIPAKQAVVADGFAKIQRRQNENVPPVPEAVDIPPYAPEAKCDDYDGYLYTTGGYTFQLQCNTVFEGDKLGQTTVDTYTDCINYCVNDFPLESVEPPDVGCVGVFWNAPYEGPGDCTAFSDLTSTPPANEVGGYQEAALVVYGPAGETYATPRPYTASSTTAPPATSTETTSSTPEPTLGPGDEFYIAVTAELPRVKRAIYYIAIGLDGFAVLVTDFTEASVFSVDANGALISNGVVIGPSSDSGVASLQVTEPPVNTPFYWEIQGGSLNFGTATFCASGVAGDGVKEVSVVFPDGQTSDNCSPILISAVSQAVPQDPSTTTTTTGSASGGTPASSGTGTVVAPTTSGGSPSASTFGFSSPEPSFTTGTQSDTFTWDVNMTYPTSTPTFSPPTTSGPSVPAQATNYLILPITQYEVQPVVSCEATDRCTPTSTTATVIRTRTGLSCVPGLCTGTGFAVNYLVDAAFLDPTCVLRPEPTT